MDTIQRMEAERACERIVALYALAVNEAKIDKFVALFTPDAVWQRPHVAPLHGHAEIRAFMESQPKERTLRHVNGLCCVTVAEDGKTATSISQTTVYETPGRGTLPVKLMGVDMVVEYRDQMVRTDAGWRFARRDTTVVFSSRV